MHSASDFFSNVIYGIGFGVLPIVLGLVIVKPWRSIINFCVAVIYVPVAGIIELFTGLVIAGVIFKDWL